MTSESAPPPAVGQPGGTGSHSPDVAAKRPRRTAHPLPRRLAADTSVTIHSCLFRVSSMSHRCPRVEIMKGRSMTARGSLPSIAGVGLLLGLVACAGPAPEASDEDSTAEPTTQTPQTTPRDAAESADDSAPEPPSVAEHAAQATWQFAPRGLNSPMDITLQDGTAESTYLAHRHRPPVEDESSGEVPTTLHEATYRMGEPVEGDLTDDGVTDAVIPITAEFGADSETLWYVWLGTADPDPGEPVAVQHPYPVAAAQKCGNDVADVGITEGAIRLQVSRVVTYHSDWQCEGPLRQGEHDHAYQSRTVTVEELDGEPALVQTEPVRSWGGVCPGTDAPQWRPQTDLQVRLRPTDDAEVIAEGSWRDAPHPTMEDGEYLMVGGFSLGADPLAEEAGQVLISYVPPAAEDEMSAGTDFPVACGWIPATTG